MQGRKHGSYGARVTFPSDRCAGEGVLCCFAPMQGEDVNLIKSRNGGTGAPESGLEIHMYDVSILR